MDSRRLCSAQALVSSLGRILREEILGLEPNDDSDAIERRVRVWLRVLEAFKGVTPGETVLVRTALFEEECGIEFQPQRSYLVYLHEARGGELRASFCSRTRPLERAAEDLAALRRSS